MTGKLYRRFGKRLVDILGAASLLAVTSPVQCAIAITVRANMGRPVLFRQARPGLNGRPFTILKFRTMSDQPDGFWSDTSDDGERLTSLGAWLRSTSLDELPELWNVLKGEMSLVGPRPLLMEYLPRYSRDQARRHEVRPGITGLAQVSGRNELPWAERLALDVAYVDGVSLRLDVRILARTLAGVLRQTGITSPGSATGEEFRPSA